MSARVQPTTLERIKNRLDLISTAEDKMALELIASCIVDDLKALYLDRLREIEPKPARPTFTVVRGGLP